MYKLSYSQISDSKVLKKKMKLADLSVPRLHWLNIHVLNVKSGCVWCGGELTEFVSVCSCMLKRVRWYLQTGALLRDALHALCSSSQYKAYKWVHWKYIRRNPESSADWNVRGVLWEAKPDWNTGIQWNNTDPIWRHMGLLHRKLNSVQNHQSHSNEFTYC